MILLLFLAFSLTPLSAKADEAIIDVPKNGILVEKVPATADVTVRLTGPKMENLPFGGWPKTQNAQRDSPAVFKDIPLLVFDGDTPHPVKDLGQTIKILGQNTGEISDLSIEAAVFNPTLGQFQLFNIFGVIGQLVGGQEVDIPDLFADTNGDGSLDTGDVLYGLVNVVPYIEALPSVALGDSYMVVNGQVAGLPGMLFSTTPFSFDPTTGFSGTLYNGPALTEGIHGATAIPEPTSLALISIGVIGLWVRTLRRRENPA